MWPYRNKYHNKKTTLGGKTFDSQKEGLRYLGLLSMQQRGEISELREQVKFVLIPTQRDENGVLVEKECSYYADFVYRDSDGQLVVEDVKGMRTDAYKIKKKLMYERYKIKIKEW